jgi:hypothetical protein
MSTALSTTLLWLFVVNLGVAFGAGIYEGRIVLADWITSSSDGGIHWNPETARQDNTGLRFWAFVTTGPLTLLTLGNLFAAWKAPGTLRNWWLAAATAMNWATLNYLRHALVLFEWLAALKAFSLFYQRRA